MAVATQHPRAGKTKRMTHDQEMRATFHTAYETIISPFLQATQNEALQLLQLHDMMKTLGVRTKKRAEALDQFNGILQTMERVTK